MSLSTRLERERPASRLLAIDLLRGIAVLEVLLCHLPFSASASPARDQAMGNISVFPSWVIGFSNFGATGVDLFLVISGFCIHMQWARRANRDEGVSFFSFWRRRLRRLYPPYFAALVLTIVGLFFLFSVCAHATGPGIAPRFGYPSMRLFVVDLVLLVLLLQNLGDASRRIGNGPFWSLALEEQLYVLYFALLGLRRRFGWRAILAVVATTSIVWVGVGGVLPHAPTAWNLVGPARWLEWTLGAVAVEAHLGLIRLPRWCASLPVGLLLLATSMAITNPAVAPHVPAALAPYSTLLIGFAYFVILNAACRMDSSEIGRRVSVASRVLAWIGFWSYSLYLTQEPLIALGKQVGLRMGLSVPGVLALRLLFALGGGYLFHRVVERRFMNTSRGRQVEAPELAVSRASGGA